jgi:hypothetical protein
MAQLELKPYVFTDETGKIIGLIPTNLDEGAPYFAQDGSEYAHIDMAEAQTILGYINATKIKIADRSATKLLSSDEEFDYLESELGMNVILPRGTIDKLRYKITLFSKESDDVWAQDGFPKNEIDEKFVIDGKIELGVDIDFNLVPMFEQQVKPLLKIDLNPWDFHIGNLKRIKVVFNGGLSKEPEWLFSDCGLENGKNLRVTLIIKKAKIIRNVEANVEAYWSYYDRWWNKIFKGAQLGTDKAKVRII